MGFEIYNSQYGFGTMITSRTSLYKADPEDEIRIHSELWMEQAENQYPAENDRAIFETHINAITTQISSIISLMRKKGYSDYQIKSYCREALEEANRVHNRFLADRNNFVSIQQKLINKVSDTGSQIKKAFSELAKTEIHQRNRRVEKIKACLRNSPLIKDNEWVQKPPIIKKLAEDCTHTGVGTARSPENASRCASDWVYLDPRNVIPSNENNSQTQRVLSKAMMRCVEDQPKGQCRYKVNPTESEITKVKDYYYQGYLNDALSRSSAIEPIFRLEPNFGLSGNSSNINGGFPYSAFIFSGSLSEGLHDDRTCQAMQQKEFIRCDRAATIKVDGRYRTVDVLIADTEDPKVCHNFSRLLLRDGAWIASGGMLNRDNYATVTLDPKDPMLDTPIYQVDKGDRPVRIGNLSKISEIIKREILDQNFITCPNVILSKTRSGDGSYHSLGAIVVGGRDKRGSQTDIDEKVCEKIHMSDIIEKMQRFNHPN